MNLPELGYFRSVKKLVVVLCVALGWTSYALAQKSGIRIEAAYYQGSLVNIHPDFPKFSTAKAAEINMIAITGGRRWWHQKYRFPDVGLAVSFIDPGNPAVLGYSLGLYPFCQFRFSITKWLKFNMKTGLGIAGFTKPYHVFSNPENRVIGSRVTAMVALSPSLVYSISERMEINLGAGLWHHSNSHFSVPNIGANYWLMKGGVSYTIREADRKSDSLPVRRPGIRFNLTAGAGIREAEGTTLPVEGPKYGVYWGGLYASRRLSHRSNFQLGVNANYYEDHLAMIFNQGLFSENQKLRSFKVMVFAGHELMFGRFSFLTQLGFNVYYPIRSKLIEGNYVADIAINRYLSSKIGFNYYLYDPLLRADQMNFFVGIGINTLGTTADFPELRIGWCAGKLRSKE